MKRNGDRNISWRVWGMGCIPLFCLVLCLSHSALFPLALALPDGALALCQPLPSSPSLHCWPCTHLGCTLGPRDLSFLVWSGS